MKNNTSIIAGCQEFSSVSGKKTTTINPPVHMGSTVLFNSCEDLYKIYEGKYEGIVYGTDRLPIQRSFEAAMQNLEGSALTRTFQSGINAIIHTLLAFTSSGDHIIIVDNVYGPTAAFCKKVLTKYNIKTDFIPADCGANIINFIRPETRLIFLESPGSNTFEIQEIPAITHIAQKHGIITVLDNTWATPLFLSPFELGVDVIIHSVTKYISGHSDVLLGSVSVNKRYSDQFYSFYQVMEAFTSSNECSLALRGLKTLSVRLKQHQRSALNIAQWLENNDLIETVLHPGLPSHPQHELWKRDFSGSSGIFSFVFKQEYNQEKIFNFINALELFGIGFSWGGYKSLVTAGKHLRRFPTTYDNRTIIRLNIGLEDPDDLREDLSQAFLALIES